MKTITPQAFRTKRKKFFRSQGAAAEFMGLASYQVVQKWETGKLPVPSYAVKFLELLERLEALGDPFLPSPLHKLPVSDAQDPCPGLSP
jgi:DNA-binding transcriptional regulator YiaG